MEEDGPAFYYVMLWYQALHPLDTTSADVPDVSSGGSDPPDIFNHTKHFVWEARSGDYEYMIGAPSTKDGEILGQYATAKPDAAATTEAEK